MTPRVAIVVPNFNGAHVIERCLAAVAAQTHAPAEVVVVDNGSTDGSAELAAGAGASVVRLARNHGFAGGANRGVAATTTPLVAVLNSDARPRPDWLAQLVATAERAPDDVWCWGSILVSSDSGLVESAGDAWNDAGYAYKLGRGLSVTDLPAEPYPCFAAPGAAPLFRRARFDDLGGYEERYFLYYEDVDLAYRALLRGWRAQIVPSARVEHDLGGSGTKPLVRYHVARNQVWTAVRCIPEPGVRALVARWCGELRFNRPLRSELRGRLAALMGLRWALRSRRPIQASRVLSPAATRARLEPPDWLRQAATKRS